MSLQLLLPAIGKFISQRYENFSMLGTAFPQENRPVSSAAESGSTMVEVLVVFLIVAILMGSGVSNLAVTKTPLLSAATELSGFVRQVRSRALATTSAYIIAPTSTTRVGTRFATTCDSGTTTIDPYFSLDLRNGVSFVDTDWSVCLSSRGLASDSLNITLTDSSSDTRTVELFLGGAVRIQ